MKKTLGTLLLSLMLVMVASTAAFADGGENDEKDKDNEREKSKDLPEVPIALMYPAAGLLTYMGYRVVVARRRHRVTA